MNIEDIKRLPISELNDLAKKLEVPGASGMRRQDLIFAILQTQAEQNGVISGSGVLEILPDGFGEGSFFKSCHLFRVEFMVFVDIKIVQRRREFSIA